MEPYSKILSAFRSAGDKAVSIVNLSGMLGISQDELLNHIGRLRNWGYRIEDDQKKGIRLIAPSDQLYAHDLLERIGQTKIIGQEILVCQQVSSTNDVALQLAHNDVREGVVVFAETQTKGRGRHGHSWLSPPGKGLWFSILLNPAIQPKMSRDLKVVSVVALAVVAATVLARVIHAETGIKPEIKWPNDVLIQKKKVAGILVELGIARGMVNQAVLGIGLNVNLDNHDFSDEIQCIATSLKIETQKTLSRECLAVAILRALDDYYALATHGRFKEVADEWGKYSNIIGRTARAQTGDQQFYGRIESLNENGALVLRAEDGQMNAFIGGNLSFDS